MKLFISLFTITLVFFYIFWITDTRINFDTKLRTREWLRNFPSWNDPDRWERYKAENKDKKYSHDN